MGFTVSAQPIAAKVQRGKDQQEVDRAVLAAFQSGETFEDTVPSENEDTVRRMLRKAANFLKVRVIIEPRNTDEVQVVTDEDGTEYEVPLTIIAFKAVARRQRANGDAVDDEDEDENENENEEAPEEAPAPKRGGRRKPVAV